MAKYPSFYGLVPRWFNTDRLYKIYVTPDSICGAWIAGQLFDHRAALLQLLPFYLVLRNYVKRLYGDRLNRESKYDAMDPVSRDFSEEDQRNFRILKSSIHRIEIRHERSLWTCFYNRGSLELTLITGERHLFLLVPPFHPDVADLFLDVPFVETRSELFPKTQNQNPYAVS